MVKQTTFGVIVGNRGFFPDVLAKEGREGLLSCSPPTVMGRLPSRPSRPSRLGGDAGRRPACADLFAAHAGGIDGIIVTLPNFGDEKAVAESIKRSGLKVPVLIHAEPDTVGKMTSAHRRDSFCGKISVCNNLNQAGIPYTLTKSHTVGVNSAEFAQDLENFAAVCSVVKGLRGPVRFGAVGAAPAPSIPCASARRSWKRRASPWRRSIFPRFSAKSTFERRRRGGQGKARFAQGLRVRGRRAKGIAPEDGEIRPRGRPLDRDLRLDGTAIQCWTSLQEFFGIMPCTLMSMMSESLQPSACEVDVIGLLGMYILQLASGVPSAILDWNNNYGDDPNKCVVFHCSNLPSPSSKRSRWTSTRSSATSWGRRVLWHGGRQDQTRPRDVLPRLHARYDGRDCRLPGRGPVCRLRHHSFGGYGVMEIPNMQALMRRICKQGFEHHVAVSLSQKAAAINEASRPIWGGTVFTRLMCPFGAELASTLEIHAAGVGAV